MKRSVLEIKPTYKDFEKISDVESSLILSSAKIIYYTITLQDTKPCL